MTDDETYAHFSILRDLRHEVKRNTEELVRRDVEMERLRAENEALKGDLERLRGYLARVRDLIYTVKRDTDDLIEAGIGPRVWWFENITPEEKKFSNGIAGESLPITRENPNEPLS